MSASPVPHDSPESFDMPDRDRTRGPLALILSSLRSPTQAAIDHISHLATTGTLTPQQSEHLTSAMNALGQIIRTVERYAPLEIATRRASQPTPRGEEAWAAGEQSDALDDRYQDAHHPLSDDPTHDTEV